LVEDGVDYNQDFDSYLQSYTDPFDGPYNPNKNKNPCLHNPRFQIAELTPLWQLEITFAALSRNEYNYQLSFQNRD
jgi:hypothetical protein